ncbi:MAG: DUF370 domain-containing protein [Clostridia bacterium]
MYLHLGEDTTIRTKDIIAIFDLDNASRSPITKEYFKKIQKENKVINVSYELPKSFVVCIEKDKEIVYISQLSPITLLKRLK